MKKDVKWQKIKWYCEVGLQLEISQLFFRS